ncbi:hypothetical protein, partial [Enterobacter hormaechei]|uniref:hypothetical protein n=1 Tax=Enterobacter hormaechei TaxID=158836 RepID=UPI002E27D5B3
AIGEVFLKEFEHPVVHKNIDFRPVVVQIAHAHDVLDATVKGRFEDPFQNVQTVLKSLPVFFVVVNVEVCKQEYFAHRLS